MSSSTTDRAAWLEARKRYLTASDVPAVLGESPYATRADLVLAKAGLTAEWEGSEQTDLGLDLEPAIAKAAARKWGWSLTEGGDLIEDRECSVLAATPDYFVLSPWGRAACQIKMTTCQAQEDCKPRKDGSASAARWANGAPLDFVLQVQAELAVTGLEWGALLVLHCSAPTFKLRSYAVQRHELVIDRIRKEARMFMAEVEALRAGKTVAA